MIVEIAQASKFGDEMPAVDGCFRSTRWVKSRCTCKTLDAVRKHKAASGWFFAEGTRNHREEDGGTVMERESEVWLVDVPSFDWCVENFGEIVVAESEVVDVKYKVTIYDDYLE